MSQGVHDNERKRKEEREEGKEGIVVLIVLTVLIVVIVSILILIVGRGEGEGEGEGGERQLSNVCSIWLEGCVLKPRISTPISTHISNVCVCFMYAYHGMYVLRMRLFTTNGSEQAFLHNINITVKNTC